MIKQMKYFQAVARLNSFTKAAEECFISQSAISQQIQALEKELGVKLMRRERRKFTLNAAGEYFYRKSLIIVNDFERLRAETMRLADGAKKEISVGYLRHYRGDELMSVLPKFQKERPEVEISLVSGTHEELYAGLRSGAVDIALSDLRRAPSAEYVNFYLTRGYLYAEIPANSPLAALPVITMEELKNTPAIIIASKGNAVDEELFFREYLGAKSEFVTAENLEAAHLMVTAGKGYFPVEFYEPPENTEDICYLPILRKGEQIFREYYAFWRADTVKEYIEPFAAMLKEKFPKEAKSADLTNETRTENEKNGFEVSSEVY